MGDVQGSLEVIIKNRSRKKTTKGQDVCKCVVWYCVVCGAVQSCSALVGGVRWARSECRSPHDVPGANLGDLLGETSRMCVKSESGSESKS